MLQAKKDEFQTYHFSVKNVGNSEVYNVNVEVFRNEPNKKTKYELFSLKESRLASGKTGSNTLIYPLLQKQMKLMLLLHGKNTHSDGCEMVKKLNLENLKSILFLKKPKSKWDTDIFTLSLI